MVGYIQSATLTTCQLISGRFGSEATERSSRTADGGGHGAEVRKSSTTFGLDLFAGSHQQNARPTFLTVEPLDDMPDLCFRAADDLGVAIGARHQHTYGGIAFEGDVRRVDTIILPRHMISSTQTGTSSHAVRPRWCHRMLGCMHSRGARISSHLRHRQPLFDLFQSMLNLIDALGHPKLSRTVVLYEPD